VGCGDWVCSRQASRGAHSPRVVRCLLSRWAPHRLWILRQDDSNVGCGDWVGSRQASRGAHLLGVVRCLLPDGRHIISGSDDKTIRMWDAETGSAVGKPLEGHTGGVSSVAYSPDGRHIISGSETRQFECGMQDWFCSRQASRGAHFTGCGQLLTLPMGATSSLDHPLTIRIHLSDSVPIRPSSTITKFLPDFVHHCQTQRVGSETQTGRFTVLGTI
jgi:WD40 repeat protein